MSNGRIKNHASLIWGIAELLRGDYKQSDYGKVVLPLTVLRRLDCVLEPTRQAVAERAEQLAKRGIQNVEPVLTSISGQQFYNTSPLNFTRLLDDPPNLADNLRAYVSGFSPAAYDIVEKFEFDAQITRLNKAKLLYQVVGRFADVDLHPSTVSNLEMGYLYEELIRRFSELSNETAGEHFTPREVIRLMVNLLFSEDDTTLTQEGIIRSVFDPACGTGGMLSVAEDHVRSLNPKATLEVFGQELNPESYAICRSDMMVKGQDASHIINDNSLTRDDGHKGRRFDYMMANPPFGVEWKKYAADIEDEADRLGFDGRYGAGLPRKSDGSMLFLQHMISKMKPVKDGGSRIGIIFNASPLFAGAAGGGESEIRRWIIENDWLEAIIALPEQLFYNTGIATYIWIVTNRKAPERAGKVQLVDARDQWTPLRKSLGEKRREISDAQIDEITRLYGAFEEGEKVKILPNHYFGFQRITVERPLQLRWEITDETLLQLEAVKEVAALDEPERAQLIAALAEHDGFSTTSDSKAQKLAKVAVDELGLKPAAIRRIVDALAVHDETAPNVTDKNGSPLPDSDLREAENAPLPPVPIKFEADPSERLASDRYRQAVDEYMKIEVLPWVPDAWVDHSKTKIGYEIPFTREFYEYSPPRILEEIDADIEATEAEVLKLLGEVMR